MVHQLFALTLQFGAISAERYWQQLSRINDFSGISHDEFETLIQHLIRENYLFISGGLLSLGSEAEKVFGRKNFMELYAISSSPVFYRVKTEAGYEVGSLGSRVPPPHTAKSYRGHIAQTRSVLRPVP
jgi:ATP-dependent Lhr-like helicase